MKRPYIQIVTSKSGNKHCYFNKRKCPRSPLPMPDAAGFAAAYEAALALTWKDAARPRRSAYEIRAALSANRDSLREHLKVVLKAAKMRSGKRGYVFDLDEDYIFNLANAQEYICAVTGIPFAFRFAERGFCRSPYRPSIDRIKPELGYSKGNVRLVCTAVNFAMNEWGESLLWEIAKNMISFRQRKAERSFTVGSILK